MKIQEKLNELNINLPKAAAPVGSYVAVAVAGDLIFISGQVSFNKDGKLIKGKIGKELNIEQGQEAAKYCALNLLAQLKKACNGNLDKVKKCIKITGYVNSIDTFIDQPKVINGASDLISNVFGEKGKHARAAVSASSLPLGAAVEIEGIFQI